MLNWCDSPYLCYSRNKVLEAFQLQKSHFKLGREKMHTAHEAADLLLVSLCTHILPSRGLEMGTLEVKHVEELPTPNVLPQRLLEPNIALLQQAALSPYTGPAVRDPEVWWSSAGGIAGCFRHVEELFWP